LLFCLDGKDIKEGDLFIVKAKAYCTDTFHCEAKYVNNGNELALHDKERSMIIDIESDKIVEMIRK
jgi:hypothetical protein